MPTEATYDGWKERFDNFFNDAKQERARKREECLTHVAVGMGTSLVAHQGIEPAAHMAARAGYRRLAYMLPFAGEIYGIYELTDAANCVIRNPY